MFSKILIANRGEIACRVIRTARRLGVRTVAVYSEADASARHVSLADEAMLIGGASPADSYLNIDAVIDAVTRSGAEAVHPGYGFLSENAEFASRCAQAGVVFIGPPVTAIEAMGSKSAAKTLMESANVPLVPGYHGAEQSPKFLQQQADSMGYPVLIKPAAGGGGKGMHVVESADQFAAELASACREAITAFGSDEMLLERYLLRPRHVEIQVFCDSHGNAVHLFERDCTLQRRHQKVIEEAPAPGLTDSVRQAMGEAALNAARAIGYEGAGTVEFIMDQDGKFFFMEMNTRLQVEHPVTEMITGQDLVEWQLRVASGESLPITNQSDLTMSGHAFEARIYAEDASRDFLPSTGTVTHLRFPNVGPNTRIDSGIREGDSITVHYDPMIAKLIVWDCDRDAALRRLQTALRDTQVVGVTTNIDFLASVSSHAAFASMQVDTGFIDRNRAQLQGEIAAIDETVLALAALAVVKQRARQSREMALNSHDLCSPWAIHDGWRMNAQGTVSLDLQNDQGNHSVLVTWKDQASSEIFYELNIDGHSISATASFPNVADGSELLANLDGRRIRATVLANEPEVVVLLRGAQYRLTLHDPMLVNDDELAGSGNVNAPMPGKVIKLLVGSGDDVQRGDALVIMEAMKMEMTITAPANGRVSDIHYAVGELVEEGAALVSFEADE